MRRSNTSTTLLFSLGCFLAFGFFSTLRESRADIILRLDFENGANLAEDSSGDMRVGNIVQVGDPGGTLTQAVGDSMVGSSSGDFFPTNSGVDGKAIEFVDGVLPDFASTDSFALSYWVKPTSDFLAFDQSSAMVSGVAIGDDAAQDFQIDNKGNTVNGDLGVARLTGPFEAALIDPATNLTPSVWQHVAVVSNGQNDQIQIFYDGALTQTIQHTSGLAFNEIFVGMNRGKLKTFDGRIDDFRLYDSAAVSEVLELSSSTIARLVVDRDTGAVTLANPSGLTQQIKSYSITSLDCDYWRARRTVIACRASRPRSRQTHSVPKQSEVYRAVAVKLRIREPSLPTRDYFEHG